MSGLHLSHALPWAEFADSDFVIYKDTGITLPIGPCNLIHLSNKKTKCQLENKKYLQDKVCLSSTCETVGEKTFYKSDKKSYDLSRGIPQKCTYTHFVNCFKTTITEFANSYSKKHLGEGSIKQCNAEKGESKNKKPAEIIDTDDKELKVKLLLEAKEVLERDKGWEAPADFISRSSLTGGCSCEYVTILMEAKKLSTILSFSDQVLRSFFYCRHGGQAVGVNFDFLLNHVLHVYIYTNLIICCNLANEPEKWGRMEPNNYFRRGLMKDCDGQTFLRASRKYLVDDIYMKDFEAMKQLSKDCFEFIYLSKIIWDKVYPDKDYFEINLNF